MKALAVLLLGLGFSAFVADMAFAGEDDNQEAGNPNPLPPVMAAEESTDQAMMQETALAELLADVEKKYAGLAMAIRELQRQIEQKLKKIKKIESDIGVSKRLLAKERAELSGYIRSAYQMGRQKQLKLLLSQRDPSLSSRMMLYYRYVNQGRLKKIAQFEKLISQLYALDQQKQGEYQTLEQSRQQKTLQQVALNKVRQ